VKLLRKIRELEDLEERSGIQRAYYVKQEKRDAVRQQMEVALFDRVDELKKQLLESDKDLQQSKDLCKEYHRPGMSGPHAALCKHTCGPYKGFYNLVI
jgi:hypothetical protein